VEAAKDRVVVMEYSLKDDKGNLIDSSEGQGPLAFIQGLGHIIPGLERIIEGKKAGDKFEAIIAAKDGYGEYNPQMIQKIPKSQFQDGEKLEEGMQFEVETEWGPALLTVTEIEGEEVTVDGNHPLAGVGLHFDIEIVEVREATEEELAHGHVHGKGGHQH
jgi:FKBP-type peptidyl-prolyl cis-trans isomerase SlyD